MTTLTTKVKSSQQCVDFLREKCKETPCAAVVLGTGIEALQDLSEKQAFSYEQVFGITPTVTGHSGTITIGRINNSTSNKLVAVFSGRFHLYEGHDWNVVTLPTQVVVKWGIPRLFLTNAVGGINPAFKVGDLMLVTGYHDLLHPKLKETGLLPALGLEPKICENELTNLLWNTGLKLKAESNTFRPLQKGVLASVLGPNYETLSEVKMLQKLKTDVVGMSVIPELKTAFGTKTIAATISVVTNVWSENETVEGHEEVMKEAKAASKRLDQLLNAVIMA